jgi:hypothetical protein
LLFGAAVVALLVVLLAAAAIYIVTLPSVSDAEQRAHQMVALHHGTYGGPGPAAKLGDSVNGYWGDVAAARGYFGTTPNALDWAQAALLAGLPPLSHRRGSRRRVRRATAASLSA